MKVGIPREIKNHEYRVAISPAGVHELVGRGHEVVIETGAGVGSSFSDEDFKGRGRADPRICRSGLDGRRSTPEGQRTYCRRVFTTP